MKKTFPILSVGILSLLMLSYGAIAQGEQISIKWPESEKWHIGNQQEDQSTVFVEYVSGKEKVTKWTTLVTITTVKNVRVPDVNKVPSLILSQTVSTCADVKQALLDTFTVSGFQAVLFKMECPYQSGSENYSAGPESQIHCIIQANTSLFMIQIAQKTAALDPEFIQKWTAILKLSEIR